jgi:hypothetical protein
VSALSGCGDLLQIPIRLPDLVSSEKRKQRLARRLSQLPDALKKLATPQGNMNIFDLKHKHPPFGKGGMFSFSCLWVNAREINSDPPFYRQSC